MDDSVITKPVIVRRFGVWLWALIGVLGFSIIPTSGVSAVSNWDAAVHTVDTLTLADFANNEIDVTTSYASIMQAECPSLYSSFQASVTNEDGNWAIVQTFWQPPFHPRKQVGIAWTIDSTATTQFENVSPYRVRVPEQQQVRLTYYNGEFHCSEIAATYFSIGGNNIDYPNGSPSTGLFLSTYPVTYPSGYAGLDFSGLQVDSEGDGLTKSQEMTQGTSDQLVDTDGDGLSDMAESVWYANRGAVFCGTQCTYPDPLKKDVYVEIDWMNDSANSRLLKPSGAQLAYVENMFDAKDINLHIDTGQFGGGEELSTYTGLLRRDVSAGQVDFWDYRNGGDGISASFSSDRNLIWRYMIYGNLYYENTASSGWAEAMGDDIFISGGLFGGMTGLASQDRAIANTIAHELGHNLCLSRVKIYEEQPAACLYGGVDNNDDEDEFYNLEDYKSVMNYRYQLTDLDDLGYVDYSDGSHGANDHNDWGAINSGMGGFTGTRTSLGAELAVAYSTSPDGSVIIQEESVNEIHEAHERSQVGEVLKTDNDQKIAQESLQTQVDHREDASKNSTNTTEQFLLPSWLTLMIAGGMTLAIGVVVLLMKRQK